MDPEGLLARSTNRNRREFMKPTTAQKFIALATILPTLVDWVVELKDINVFRHTIAQDFSKAIESAKIADRKLFERTGMVTPKFNEDGEVMLNKKGLPIMEPISDQEYKERSSAMADQQAAVSSAFMQWVSKAVVDPTDK
jgi:hypothetical protein